MSLKELKCINFFIEDDALDDLKGKVLRGERVNIESFMFMFPDKLTRQQVIYNDAVNYYNKLHQLGYRDGYAIMNISENRLVISEKDKDFKIKVDVIEKYSEGHILVFCSHNTIQLRTIKEYKESVNNV